MNEITTMINSVGFPMFVAIWMLLKDAKEKELTRATLSELTTVVKVLTLKMGVEHE